MSAEVFIRNLDAVGHALDSFDGITDDAKLDNALAYAAAQDYPAMIMLGNRAHTFTTPNRPVYHGLRIIGPDVSSAPEKFGSTKMGLKIRLAFSGSWFHNTLGSGRAWGITLANLSFSGSSNARVLTNDSASQFSLLRLHNISCVNIKSVCGTLKQPLVMTGCAFTGFCHINGCYQTAFHLSGSDNNLFTDGGLIDSTPTHHSEGLGGAGQAHLWCDYLDYTRIGRLFITCEGPWRGLKISGPTYGTSSTSDNHGNVSFADGFTVQGRFGSARRANGACVRIEGGTAKFRSPNIDFGMQAPAGTGDLGIVHQTGGYLMLDSPQYIRGETPESVPFVYSTGADSHGDLSRVTKGRMAWTGKPVVQKQGGSQISVDSSFTATA